MLISYFEELKIKYRFIINLANQRQKLYMYIYIKKKKEKKAKPFRLKKLLPSDNLNRYYIKVRKQFKFKNKQILYHM
jgi:hypothetical protein